MTEFERFDGAPVLIAKAPSAVTKLEMIDGILFANTAKHGWFKLIDGMLISVVSPPTSQARH